MSLIHENAFQNVVCQMPSILLRPQFIKSISWSNSMRDEERFEPLDFDSSANWIARIQSTEYFMTDGSLINTNHKSSPTTRSGEINHYWFDTYSWTTHKTTPKTESCHDANFAVAGSTVRCCYDNMRWRKWRQSWHHENSRNGFVDCNIWDTIKFHTFCSCNRSYKHLCYQI